MRVKTLSTDRFDEFDSMINDYLRLVKENGCETRYIQVTHLPERLIATIIYEEYIPSTKSENPDFVVADVDPNGKPTAQAFNLDGTPSGRGLKPINDHDSTQQAYSNIDNYEKY